MFKDSQHNAPEFFRLILNGYQAICYWPCCSVCMCQGKMKRDTYTWWLILSPLLTKCTLMFIMSISMCLIPPLFRGIVLKSKEIMCVTFFYNRFVNTHLTNISPCGWYETICSKITKLYIVKLLSLGGLCCRSSHISIPPLSELLLIMFKEFCVTTASH